MSTLSDDDYARTDLFKHIKSQYEDVINRVNNLEAINIQLREEASTLQAERSAYREKIEFEVQAPIGELEQKLSKAETDLARIRAARDELGADVSIRKASHERDQATYDQMKELLGAREERIAALESEAERLRLQLSQSDQEATTVADLSKLSLEELMKKYMNLEREYSLINDELPSMGAAWKKASALASKKVADTLALEEKATRLQAEKSKADQKYFATMKLNEAREVEVKTLRAQNQKSSEIVAQLKDVEISTRQLVSNLEKQLTETKDVLTTLTNQNRNLQQQIVQSNITMGGLKSQVTQLTSTLRQKDAALGMATKSQRQFETEVEQLRIRLADTEKSIEGWKTRATGNESAESDALRVRISWCFAGDLERASADVPICRLLLYVACANRNLRIRR